MISRISPPTTMTWRSSKRARLGKLSNEWLRSSSVRRPRREAEDERVVNGRSIATKMALRRIHGVPAKAICVMGHRSQPTGVGLEDGRMMYSLAFSTLVLWQEL